MDGYNEIKEKIKEIDPFIQEADKRENLTYVLKAFDKAQQESAKRASAETVTEKAEFSAEPEEREEPKAPAELPEEPVTAQKYRLCFRRSR